MALFVERDPTLESVWRSIILFGKNVASYKFALAQSLLELAQEQQTTITLDQLAAPYARHIAEHLKLVDKQATSPKSQFLDSCRAYNRGEIGEAELVAVTTERGFNNVIDAFHNVNQTEVPFRFFIDQRGARTKSIVLTDDLYQLKQSVQQGNLPVEVEARWRLVETAWSVGVSTSLLQINVDQDNQSLYTQDQSLRRISVTSVRSALNGYQKGKCFYCFRDIAVGPTEFINVDPDANADVDHFFPHSLQRQRVLANLDKVWNLVLACKECNRGGSGKFAQLPRTRYLERLHTRNEFLITSHHPLRETLIVQTGATPDQRRQFLQQCYREAQTVFFAVWQPKLEWPAAF